MFVNIEFSLLNLSIADCNHIKCTYTYLDNCCTVDARNPYAVCSLAISDFRILKIAGQFLKPPFFIVFERFAVLYFRKFEKKNSSFFLTNSLFFVIFFWNCRNSLKFSGKLSFFRNKRIPSGHCTWFYHLYEFRTIYSKSEKINFSMSPSTPPIESK